MQKRIGVVAYFDVTVEIDDNDEDPDTTIGEIIDALEDGNYMGYPSIFSHDIPDTLHGYNIEAREIE